MTRPWTGFSIRRVAVGLALGAVALLAGCGSSSVVSDLQAERFIAVGDGFSDVGQGPTGQPYTVADGSPTWLQQLASYYKLEVKPASAGGWGYAQGHARVDSADPRGAPSVREQVDELLAATTLDPKKDVVFINGGMNDIVAAVEATGISEATNKAVEAAADALAEQVRRLRDAGARHIAVIGVYWLGQSPWGRAYGHRVELNELSNRFNTRLLVGDQKSVLGIAPFQDNSVAYVDAAAFYYTGVSTDVDRVNDRWKSMPIDNLGDAVCNTPDASTCTPSTLKAGVSDYDRYLFADDLHLTPAAQRLFSDSGYSIKGSVYYELHERW
ncbi:MAG TPA: SGNH/GDSL hydrolase family protein [Ottowia sp.]|uniref:SGNH/GDSL hydrolase family protein n=1 Tax=Ottowia sp. TaxID=1898956 RepID=UPI002CB20774|nr:SGNH/GDSL hydrolase family protein [Ottowia sp.]HMN21674.1 SGNH/GDSL hydrolase family protein [Ottowia sp.]